MQCMAVTVLSMEAAFFVSLKQLMILNFFAIKRRPRLVGTKMHFRKTRPRVFTFTVDMIDRFL